MPATAHVPACWTFMATLAICVVYIVESAERDVQAIDLSGGWTLRNLNQSIRVPGRVPGYAPQILYEAGVLPEPLSRCNGSALATVQASAQYFDRLQIQTSCSTSGLQKRLGFSNAYLKSMRTHWLTNTENGCSWGWT